MKTKGFATIALLTGQLSSLVSLYRYHVKQSRRTAVRPMDDTRPTIFQPEHLQNQSNHTNTTFDVSNLKQDNQTSLPQVHQPKKRYKVAVAIISSFDWEERAPYVSFRDRRQLHRDTWMQHPAITEDEDVTVYFVLGNQQHRSQGNPKQATHFIKELAPEMDHYGDIVLLNGFDMHNHGKNNAWYEWVAAAPHVEADYHIKLDDESYVILDRLLAAVEAAPTQKFLGGVGHYVNGKYGKFGHLNRVPFLRGWGYIMSEDLMLGLGNCSAARGVQPNSGQHEDVYNGIALRVCGMMDQNITVAKGMQVHSLRHVLSLGCPSGIVDQAMIIHSGMRTASGENPFPKVSAQTFRSLHSIYNPQLGDLTPSLARWEGLRQLYMEDLGACKIHQGWTCSEGWENRTCLPAASKRQ